MKIIGKIIKTLIALAVALLIIVVGSFSAVFFISRDNPQEIFLLDYALICRKGEDEKLDVWFVQKTDSDSLEHGDAVVYFDSGYKAAYAMLGFDGRVIYYDADEFEKIVSVDETFLVGEIVALWQQK